MRALWPGGRQPAGVTVKLNVYDLDSPGNEFLSALGLGLYHTGVEVDGREYSYGAGYGIGDARPRSAAQNPGVARFRGSYVMGQAESLRALGRAVDELRGRFPASAYDLVQRNCNHFTDALVFALCGRHTPGWVNRAATVGSCVACLVPAQERHRDPTTGAPADRQPLTAPLPRAFSGRGNALGGTDSPTLSRARTPPPSVRFESQEMAPGKRALIRNAALLRFEASPD